MSDRKPSRAHPSYQHSQVANQPNLTRRKLLNTAAVASIGAVVAGCQTTSHDSRHRSSYGQSVAPKPGRRVLGANDKILLGIIGSGGMGRHHMHSMLHNNQGQVEFIAVCDIYEANRNEAIKITEGKAKGFNEHERLLELDDVDAVVIASPDHWHERHLVDSVLAGKDAYSEKPMSYSLDQGANMVKQVRRTDRIVQIGMQRRSTPSIQEAKKIVDEGFLGEVSLVRAHWFWNVEDLPKTWQPEGQLDWHRFQAPLPAEKRYPLTPESGVKYRHWRYFWEYSGGNMTDQGTHLIDVIQWFMSNSMPPHAAQEHGAVYQIKGYETPDTFSTVLEYPKFMATWTLSYTNNWHDGWEIIFHGRHGTLELDNYGARFYREPWPRGWRNNPPDPEQEVPGSLRVDLHEKNFFECVRTRKQPNCPVEIGHQAISALHLANAAHHAKRRAVLDWDKQKIVIP